MCHRSILAAAVLACLTGGRCEAGTYTWNNTGTDWGTASSWSPAGGPPDASNSDLALFTPNGSSGTIVQDPNIAGNQSALSLTLFPNQLFGGWTIGGSGILGVGGPGSTGLTASGPATYTFNGPTLQGNSSSSLLNFTLTNGSAVVLAGNSTASNNFSTLAINGGTFRLDNSVISMPRLAATGTVAVSGGGSLELIGNSAASVTENAGNLATVTNSFSGVNTIKVSPNGQATTLNFANSGSINLSPGSRAVIAFQATSGNLGDSNGARVTFGSGSPNLGAGGLLAVTNNSSSQQVGFAIVNDALGANWA
ncbi:MAG: hypothetical protein ACJ8F7_01640, partial [Gemmataceae bacterium]